MKILNFIDKVGVKIANDSTINEKNQPGWITITELYKRLEEPENVAECEINTDYFKRKHLTEILQRLNFEFERKTPGISYHITQSIVNEINERMGMNVKH